MDDLTSPNPLNPSTLMQDTLFPSIPITKSPKLLWMERYKISSVEHKEIQGYTWTATYRKWLNEQCRVTYDCAGKTEDAAITALALAAGIRLWFEPQD